VRRASHKVFSLTRPVPPLRFLRSRVVELEGDWDKFFAERLRPAFEKVGSIPQPQLTRFDVHASYTAP